jgi:hypothetical protein
VLPAIVSRLFPPRDHLEIRGRQDFASLLESDDNRLAINSPRLITKRVDFLVTKLNSM